MADNVTTKDASNVTRTVAADNVGDVYFQKMKLDIGGDGVSVPFTDPATSAKQDALQSAIEALQTAVGLLAKLTDTQPVSLASVPSHAVTNEALGTTTDAAVVTDTTGTISGKLRGIIKLLLDKITVKLETDAGTGANAKVVLRAFDWADEEYHDINTGNGGAIPIYMPSGAEQVVLGASNQDIGVVSLSTTDRALLQGIIDALTP